LRLQYGRPIQHDISSKASETLLDVPEGLIKR